MTENLEAQNRVIISLLARSTLGTDNIAAIVRSGKKIDAEKYVKAYNALDGTKTGTDLAKVAGVSKQAFSQVLKTWERAGIVYKAGDKYIGLLTLPVGTRKADKKAGKKGGKKGKKKADATTQVETQGTEVAMEQLSIPIDSSDESIAE